MSVIHAPKRPDLDFRAMVFPVSLGSCLFVLFVRLWYFQVLKASEYSDRAEAGRYSVVAQPAPRGLIFDREGKPIATVRPQFVVTAVPAIIKKNPEVLAKVAALLNNGVTEEKLAAKVKEAQWRPFLASPIYAGASIEAGTRIAEQSTDLPGIGVDEQPMRSYEDTVALCHVLGRVGVPFKEDLERLKTLGLEGAQVIGKAGLERTYEKHLAGEAGNERVEVDSKRRPVRVIERSASVPGHQLQLTINLDLQKYALDLLKNSGHTGAVVAIDPKNGEVLCLASAPTFDQAMFADHISQSDWKNLRDNEDHPMVNRAISTALAPGSIFKIITSLAAFESGHFNPSDHYVCNGGMDVGNRFIKCLGHHGSIGYEDALAKSCNVYFFNLAKLCGEDALRQASKEFGLGLPSGIELGSDSTGLIPTEEYIKKVRARGKWYTGDTMNFAIGQGFVATTPIQMANVIAQVANNGVRYKPHLVKEIRDANNPKSNETIQPEITSNVPATPEFWAELKASLRGVVEHGTATVAKLDGETLAGKTGSAEHGIDKEKNEKKTHAWFVGFAPVEQPQIAICVLVEKAGHGGDIAAPIARDLLNHYFKVTLKQSAKPSGSPKPN